ncbi:macrophage mannose receptor 1-like [Antedon mediterranea]|uniref:macrophage mannose receptor 1-like n=1 Tax=Antedon mediterranea TaxID=105859 RepID=UPI003AF42723
MFRIIIVAIFLHGVYIATHSCNLFTFNTSIYSIHVHKESESPDVRPTQLQAEKICMSSGGQLVSLTTEQELKAVYNFLKNFCPIMSYTVGLSRQSGLERNVSQNWVWSSGEQHTGEINWGFTDPNVDNSETAFARLFVEEGNVGLPIFLENPEEAKANGYICEKHNTSYIRLQVFHILEKCNCLQDAVIMIM